MVAPWYEREDKLDELMVFGRAIQGVLPYEVVIETDPTKCRTGICSFDSRRISVNPTHFNVPEAEQFLLTKALLAHEAGHRRYTIPTMLPSIIREIANIIEDERIERQMWQEFVGVQWLISKLAARLHDEAKPIDICSDLPKEVVTYFLRLRWATRIGQPIKGGLSLKNQALWEMVEPLVYESWQADNSMVVNRNATKIAETLGIDNYKH